MLNTLQFNMSVPTPYVFMKRYLKAAQSDRKVSGDWNYVSFRFIFCLFVCLFDCFALSETKTVFEKLEIQLVSFFVCGKKKVQTVFSFHLRKHIANIKNTFLKIIRNYGRSL